MRWNGKIFYLCNFQIAILCSSNTNTGPGTVRPGSLSCYCYLIDHFSVDHFLANFLSSDCVCQLQTVRSCDFTSTWLIGNNSPLWGGGAHPDWFTPALLCHKVTAQGTEVPLLVAFLAFYCVIMTQGWLPFTDYRVSMWISDLECSTLNWTLPCPERTDYWLPAETPGEQWDRWVEIIKITQARPTLCQTWPGEFSINNIIIITIINTTTLSSHGSYQTPDLDLVNQFAFSQNLL